MLDSGASKHMIGYKYYLKELIENNSTLQVELGDNTKHAVKGVGTWSFYLDSGDSLHMKDVLFVLGLKNNLLSISTLEYRGYTVAFMDGQVLVWPNGSSIESTWVIGVREGGI